MSVKIFFFCPVCGRRPPLFDPFEDRLPDGNEKCDCGFDFNKPARRLTKSIFTAAFCPICGRRRNEGLGLDPVLGLGFLSRSWVREERKFDRCLCGFDFQNQRI